MPFYDYHCEECGSTFEVKRSMSEEDGSPSPECTCCGGAETRRVFGNFFNGGGGGDGGSSSGPT